MRSEVTASCLSRPSPGPPRSEREGDGLHVQHRKLPTRPLTAAFEDALLLWSVTILALRRGRGRVDGFALSDGRVWGVRFDRMEG